MYGSFKYWARGISLSELSDQVSGLINREVTIGYGENYSVKRLTDDSYHIIIPKGTYKLTPTVRSGILHEAMHIRYTDLWGVDFNKFLDQFGKNNAEKKAIFYFIDCFEDIRIHKKCEQEYYGAKWIFQEGRDESSGEVYKRLSRNAAQDMVRSRVFLIQAIEFFGGYADHPLVNNTRWLRPASQDLVDNSLKLVNFDWSSWAKKYATTHFIKPEESFDHFAMRLRDTKTTIECFEIAADEFLDTYKKMLPDLSKALTKEDIMDILRKLIKAIASDTAPKKDEDEETSSSFQIEVVCDGDEDLIKELVSGTKKKEATREEITNRIKLIKEHGEDIINPLSDVLRQIKEWQENKQEERFLRRGKLDRTRMYRVSLREEDVFKRKHQQKFQDNVAFAIALDTSGSMWGRDTTMDPLNTGLAIAYGLNQSLAKIEKPVSTVDFGNPPNQLIDFEERCDEEKLEEILTRGGSGTYLDCSVKQAIKSLRKRTETKKVCFIITDGDVSYNEIGLAGRNLIKDNIIPFFIVIRSDADSFMKLVEQECQGFADKIYREGVKPGKTKEVIDKISAFTKSLLTKEIYDTGSEEN